jgi:hypothetical protein
MARPSGSERTSEIDPALLFYLFLQKQKMGAISIYLSEGIVEFQGPALPDVPRIVSLEASS